MKMRNIFLSAMLGLSVCLAACKDEWDNHYSQEQGEATSVSELTLYDYLKSQPDYSRFMELMDETGVGKELEKNQVLTAWVVSNEHMPADYSAYSAEEKVRLAKQHINYMALYSPKLQAGKTIKSTAGKNLSFTQQGDGLALDGKSIVKPNQLCANGVVHEIEALMIPRDNIYEKIVKAGDEYSIFRDTILSHSDTVFDEKSSFPLGVDEYGNTIYDSVFVIENPYFDKGDFRNENGEYTLFIPSNAQIKAAMDDIVGLYEGDVTEEERVLFFDWIMKSALYKGVIETYTPGQTYQSLWDKVWKTDKQLVAPEAYVASNGRVYTVTHLHIPRNLLLQDIDFKFIDCWDKLSEEERSQYFVMENATGYKDWLWNKIHFFHCYHTPWDDDKVLTLEVTVLVKDRFGKPKPARLFSGAYRMEHSYRSYLLQPLDIYANGELVAEQIEPDEISDVNNHSYGYVADVVVPESQPVTTMKIKFVCKTGHKDLKEKRLAIQGIKLIPDKSIY